MCNRALENQTKKRLRSARATITNLFGKFTGDTSDECQEGAVFPAKGVAEQRDGRGKTLMSLGERKERHNHRKLTLGEKKVQLVKKRARETIVSEKISNK